MKTSNTVKIRITLGKVRMYHTFCVVPELGHDMILGIDFLKERKAHLDFENHTLIVGKQVHLLKEKPSQSQTLDEEIALVRIAEDVDLYPRSDIQVKYYLSKK